MGSDQFAQRTYMGSAPYGSMYPHERLDLMDKENLEKAILYPTIMLNWEHTTPDPRSRWHTAALITDGSPTSAGSATDG
jgi:hypothetical protein